MAKIFIPRARGVFIPEEREQLHECSNCWMLFQSPELDGAVASYSSVAVGIHQLVRYDSETPEFLQYHEGEWSPFIREVFNFCPLCSSAMVERFFLIVSECLKLPYEYLLEKPNMAELIPGLGHFITLIEYVPGHLGRYFNVQMDKVTYRRLILEYVPGNIVSFHKGELILRAVLR